MLPILISIQSWHIYSISVFLVLSFFVFSFVFWRQMKDFGVDDDKIFDSTFYGTLVAFFISRLVYVALHWNKFSDNLLKITVIWILPGMSLFGAVIGITGFLMLLARSYKVRIGYILDSLAYALPFTLIVGLIGGFLDGSRIGKATHLFWAVHYVGSPGSRHPVQIYEIISLLGILVILYFLQIQANKRKWIYGMMGVCFFILFGITQFVLEFVKENSIYWLGLSFNQWAALAIISESLGVIYVKGGGKESGKKMIRQGILFIQTSVKGAKNAISKRFTRKNPNST